MIKTIEPFCFSIFFSSVSIWFIMLIYDIYDNPFFLIFLFLPLIFFHLAWLNPFPSTGFQFLPAIKPNPAWSPHPSIFSLCSLDYRAISFYPNKPSGFNSLIPQSGNPETHTWMNPFPKPFVPAYLSLSLQRSFFIHLNWWI